MSRTYRHIAMSFLLLALAPLKAAAQPSPHFINTAGKYCPQYYACVYVNGRTEGYDFAPSDTRTWGWSGASRTKPSSQIRNRNLNTRRSMVIMETTPNGRTVTGRCIALRYDERGWVNTNGFKAYAILLTSVSRPPGSTYNIGRGGWCTSTRWI